MSTSKTIMIVDDHADTNEVLCRILSTYGYRCVNAFTGEGALALLSSERPDVIILDWMMPGMDGLEVIRAMRANPRTALIPVIIHSALADPQFKEHALSKGANEYWAKGTFDPSTLLQRLAPYLQ